MKLEDLLAVVIAADQALAPPPPRSGCAWRSSDVAKLAQHGTACTDMTLVPRARSRFFHVGGNSASSPGFRPWDPRACVAAPSIRTSASSGGSSPSCDLVDEQSPASIDRPQEAVPTPPSTVPPSTHASPPALPSIRASSTS